MCGKSLVSGCVTSGYINKKKEEERLNLAIWRWNLFWKQESLGSKQNLVLVRKNRNVYT